jgi:hypothetical protein
MKPILTKGKGRTMKRITTKRRTMKRRTTKSQTTIRNKTKKGGCNCNKNNANSTIKII